MPRTITGTFQGQGLQVAIAAARFNDAIVDRLLAGAIDALVRHGVADGDILVVRVPGAFELPLVCDRLAASKKHHAVIALGAVIKGETPHFDHVCAGAVSGIANANRHGVPVIFGVLTTLTVEQAADRAGLKSGNKGADAAIAAIEMATLLRSGGL